MKNRNRQKHTALIRAVSIAGTLLLLAAAVFAVRSFRVRSAELGQEKVFSDPFAKRERIEYKGESYIRNGSVETYLILGIDTDGEDASSELGGQADVLFLLVMDGEKDIYRVLQLNRDTVTQVTSLASDGSIGEAMFAPICLAHGFGSGGADSCENTVRAVRYLLSGVEIEGYAALGMDALGRLSELVGGVPVTIEKDLTAVDPEFKAGASVVLGRENTEGFLRVRRALGESDNISRMSRHRQYMESWSAAARARIAADSGVISEYIEELSQWIVTDMTEKRMSSVADSVYKYSDGGFITLSGENEYDGSFNRFYADEDSLLEIITELFYKKENG